MKRLDRKRCTNREAVATLKVLEPCAVLSARPVSQLDVRETNEDFDRRIETELFVEENIEDELEALVFGGGNEELESAYLDFFHDFSEHPVSIPDSLKPICVVTIQDEESDFADREFLAAESTVPAM